MKPGEYFRLAADIDSRLMVNLDSVDIYNFIMGDMYPEVPKHRKDLIIHRGEYRLPEPVTFLYKSGRKYFDFLWTSISFTLISEHVASILEANKFTGYSLARTVITRKRGPDRTDYYMLIVHGRSGKEIRLDAWVEEKLIGGFVSRVARGIDPGLDQWDGSDFFVPEGTSRVIITRRVRDKLVEAGCTGMDITDMYDV